MSRNEKMKFIRLIEGSDLCIGDALAKYDVPRSTYYRWKRKLKSQGIKGLQDNKPYRATKAEEYIRGKSIDDSNAEGAANAAITDVCPLTKNRYKIQIVKTLVKRAILACNSNP